MRGLEPRKQLAQPARRLRSKVAHWRSPSFSITTTKRIGLQCQISTKTRSLLYPDIKLEPGGEQLRFPHWLRFCPGTAEEEPSAILCWLQGSAIEGPLPALAERARCPSSACRPGYVGGSGRTPWLFRRGSSPRPGGRRRRRLLITTRKRPCQAETESRGTPHEDQFSEDDPFSMAVAENSPQAPTPRPSYRSHIRCAQRRMSTYAAPERSPPKTFATSRF